METRYAHVHEIKEWNNLVLKNPDGGEVLQGEEFAEQKALADWHIRHIISGGVALIALQKHIPFLGKVWYVPRGPGVTNKEHLAELLPSFTEFARTQGVFTIKIEPPIPHDASLEDLGLTKTRPIQANYSTVLIDLHGDLDTIMKHFPQKGRHAIRRAERDGVTVKQVPATDENCRIMYQLLKETSDDAEFGIRPPKYYRTFYNRYETLGMGQLFFAQYEGQVVAGAFALLFGDKSTYKDGASIRQRTAYGASHLLQWHVIQWAKQHGSVLHDLCGAPPIAERDNPEHPYYGIGKFKTSFNKEITEYVGAYEIPVSPAKSALWTRYLEKAVRLAYYKKNHESYY